MCTTFPVCTGCTFLHLCLASLSLSSCLVLMILVIQMLFVQYIAGFFKLHIYFPLKTLLSLLKCPKR